MTSSVLLIIAVALNVLFLVAKGHRWRILVCAVVFIPTAAHAIADPYLGDLEYYGFAVLGAMIVYSALEWFPRSPLVADIQILQILIMVCNLFGLALYQAGSEPLVYNVLLTSLAIIEWLRLMVRTKQDGEHWRCNFMRSIRTNAHSQRGGVFK